MLPTQKTPAFLKTGVWDIMFIECDFLQFYHRIIKLYASLLNILCIYTIIAI